MGDALKQVTIGAASIVFAFVLIWIIVAYYNKIKKPCGCNGGGAPSIKPGDGTVIDNTPAPVAPSYGDGGFDYAS